MKNYSIRNYVFIALFAAVFVVMSAITLKIPISPVPITLQTLAVTLAGLFLGARNGFLSILLVLVLTAVGLPLLHGQGGLATLLGGTGGFLIGFPFSALLIGLVTGPLLRSKLAGGNRIVAFIALFVVCELFGSLFAYIPGVPWMMHVYDWSFGKAMTAGCYPFLPGDALKSLLAAAIGVSLKPYILRMRASTVDRAPYSPDKQVQG